MTFVMLLLLCFFTVFLCIFLIDWTCCSEKSTYNSTVPTVPTVPTVYQEEPCTARNGVCQWSNTSCQGYFARGLCPTQPAQVRCCIPLENKHVHALKETFRFEGSCQNDKDDKGNHFNGTIGYSCMGITPMTGWTNRKFFTGCEKFTKDPALFTKHCFDHNKVAFKDGAHRLYRQKYFHVCEKLDDPAFFVCADISVNSGPTRVTNFMKSLCDVNECGNVKFARKLNEMHREFYKTLAQNNSKYKKFLKSWMRRVEERDTYINSFS